jgi:hypothetical protein
MTGTQVIAKARLMLNDEVEPYKWKTSELVDYLNDALKRMSFEADNILDPSTTAVVDVTLAAGTIDYAVDSRIWTIESAKLSTADEYLIKVSKGELDSAFGPDWRSTDAADRDTPLRYCLDWKSGYISLNPCPDAIATLNLTTTRSIAADFTAATLAATSIELAAVWHERLVDGVLARALLKRGATTYDPKASDRFEMGFRKLIDDVKRSALRYKQAVRPRIVRVNKAFI